MDDNYKLNGLYIKTKEHQSFSINSLKYIGDNKENLNKDVFNIEYKITENDYKQIIHTTNMNTSLKNIINKNNLLQTINFSSFNIEGKFKHISEKNDLIFQIIYRDKNNQKQNIDIKFKLVKKYDNKL